MFDNIPCSHMHSFCATDVSGGLATMVTMTRVSEGRLGETIRWGEFDWTFMKSRGYIWPTRTQTTTNFCCRHTPNKKCNLNWFRCFVDESWEQTDNSSTLFVRFTQLLHGRLNFWNVWLILDHRHNFNCPIRINYTQIKIQQTNPSKFFRAPSPTL